MKNLLTVLTDIKSLSCLYSIFAALANIFLASPSCPSDCSCSAFVLNSSRNLIFSKYISLWYIKTHNFNVRPRAAPTHVIDMQWRNPKSYSKSIEWFVTFCDYFVHFLSQAKTSHQTLHMALRQMLKKYPSKSTRYPRFWKKKIQ